MLLWTYRAAQFYGRANNWQLTINSAYRCSIDNRNHGRSSTNHHGKAIDIDILGGIGTDRSRCNELRSILQEKAGAQLGWAARDRKALEPPNIAPTWVHLDVRCYQPAHLDDRYFVTSLEALDSAPPGTAAEASGNAAESPPAAPPAAPPAPAAQDAANRPPPIAFAGPGTRLESGDIEAAARELGCTVAAIRAVIDVESRGGFLADGRPRILFERHHFSRLTNRVHDAAHADISNRKAGGYSGGAGEYERLGRAIALDRDAALRSASWGMFQIMGSNCGLAGFPDAESFVAAMVGGEKAHLDAFVGFVRASGLADELARCDWPAFARGYNGPNYAINRYDTKLAAAFAIHSAGGPRVNSPLPLLRMGDEGEFVTRLQTALGIPADGDFGPATKAAVVDFQRKHGLHADGIVGLKTWSLLND
jgi:peptidoglycan hydrolase-like protein with peptidoglycan-binding domain